ncbi:MAG: SpoIIE family protein phosphatase [Verrucomicrobia bacterium]|nr:SpoIIE family protein phosphatase [Verrucomicrobiota bacterium]
MSSEPFLPAPSGVVRYTIPADLAAVDPLRQRFIDTISNGELSAEDLDGWKLVFQELVVNAIAHGAKHDPARAVTIEWSIAHNAIILAAEDPGPGPPDAKLLAPALPEDPLAVSGRGLFIIANCTDQRRWWRGPDGFRLEVLKHYPSAGLPLPSNPELDSVLEELSSCYESLTVFHRLTGSLIESGNLRDFITSSLDEFLSLHPLERIFFQAAPTIPDTVRKLLGSAAWFLDPTDSDPALRGLGTLTRETVWEDFADLARQHPGVTALRSVGAGSVFPIIAGGLHFGALIALRKPAVVESKSRSLGTLRTLADLCGIACANAHLTNLRDESQKDLRELEIAVEIQKGLLPILPAPVSDRWLVSIYQESSLTIAGDYAIARTDPAGNLVVAMIDVMGKGVSAALLASIFRTAFELSLQLPSSSAILETINKTLCTQLGDLTMFLTCSIARVSADGRSLEHSSAGHCPTFFYKADGSRTFFEPSGPPLGILAAVTYANDRVALEGGERLVFVTDGCYEWDRREQNFGWDRLVEHMDQDRTASPPELWTHLRDRIRNQCGLNLEDDCTLITLDLLK